MSASTADVLLAVSIDTEEDNWAPRREGVTVENIRQLPRLHQFLTDLGVRPTYFTNHQVLQQEWACRILQDIHQSGAAEIAGHLHPWNTPPVREELSWRNSMVCNLSSDLQRSKLAQLTRQLTDLVGASPTSFRAGRFGLGRELVSALIEGGYEVDSSVTPYIDWGYCEGPNFMGAPVSSYRLEAGADPRVPSVDGSLVELPVTSGFSRRPFAAWSRVHRMLDGRVLRPLKAPGLAARTHLVRKILLSPETDSVEDMLQLSRTAVREGARHLMLFFHSSSLQPGLSPFTPTGGDVERLYESLREFLGRVTEVLPIRFATTTEVGRQLHPFPPAAEAANPGEF